MKSNPLKILILDDEAIFALELANTLTKKGYKIVDYVTNAKLAKEIIEKEEINLIIMDINLNEKKDGIELYADLKTDAAVIYLTSYIDEKTISRAIQSEPLGYLVKPYNETELLALLKLANLKFKSQTTLQNLEILPSDYSFDMANEKLYHKGNYVKLGKKSLKLLKMLILAHGNSVSFDEIEMELYRDNPPSASSIRTLIYRLRNSLKAEMIESELSYGVRLVL